MKKGKKYLAAVAVYDKSKEYSLEEGVALLPKLSTSKFEGTVEAHVRLNLSDTEKRQLISGALTFPHSFGKGKSVLVLCDAGEANKAKAAGADYVGLEDLVKKISEGWTDFDVVIATPAVMPKIAILGKVLGPKGLMPNPKKGTITPDVETAVKEYKAGKTTFKSDKQGIVHAPVSKVNTEAKNIEENILALIKKVLDAGKRSPTTGLESIVLSPTMGPSVKINLEDVISKL